jgi:hypothetical protein
MVQKSHDTSMFDVLPSLPRTFAPLCVFWSKPKKYYSLVRCVTITIWSIKSKQCESTPLPSNQNIAALKVLMRRLLVLPIILLLRWKLVWNSGGMILTGENRRTLRENCHRATWFTTNLAWTGLGSNPGFSGERSATHHRSHGTAV